MVLYDGLCNLCTGSVKFVLKRDKKNKFKFAALQSGAGIKLCQQYQIDLQSIDSIILIRGGKVYVKSSAILEILKELPAGWKILSLGVICPQFLRDWIYNLVAKNRYRIFGKRAECFLPSKDIIDKFL